MKLKCNDGLVRNFIPAKEWSNKNGYFTAYCNECGYEFGIHDTKYLKPQFKNHVCKISDVDKWKSENIKTN